MWYYPERDLAYDETGLAHGMATNLWQVDRQWRDFRSRHGHGGTQDAAHAKCRSGDKSGQWQISGCRINDRGPFVAGRVIDLSREAARLIGYRDQGIARVRVQVLAEQTLRLEKLAKSGNFAEITGDVVAMPTFAVVEQPEVSMTATSSTGKTVNSDAEDDNVSAIELLARSRVGEGDNSCPDKDPAMGAGRCLLCSGQRVKCACQVRGCRHGAGIAG